MVVRAVESEFPGLLQDPPSSFSGTWGSFSPTHAANAKKAEYNGLLAGLSLSQLGPWGDMPRGEVAQVLYNLLGVMEEGTAAPQNEAQVTRVIDGDTIAVTYQGTTESVRLIGIDTPETGENFASEATAALRGLVDGQTVDLEFDVDRRDQYDRLLAYVWVGSTMANEEMVRKGLATLYTVPPNVKYGSRLQSALADAKGNNRGMWGSSSQSPLEVTSIHANAAGNDHNNLNDEYIDFLVTVSGTLAGYTVEDETGHRYDFPDRVFNSGDTFRLHTGFGTDSQNHLYWGSGSAIWNNSGDTIYVLDSGGHVVLEESY